MNNVSGEALRPAGVVKTLVTATIALLAGWSALAMLSEEIPALSVFLSLCVWSGMVVLVWKSVQHHQHGTFGPANQITTARAVVAAALSGLVPIAASLSSSPVLWTIAIIATLSLCMDGIDGYVARRTRLVSPFGARFDMETDAFLAFIIALFLWQSGKVGLWVLALGVMRYAFVFTSIWITALKADLFPSLRRKVFCVIQVASLCLMLCPWLSSLQASIVGVVGLACLTYSFAVDVIWLLGHSGHSSRPRIILSNNKSPSETATSAFRTERQ